MLLQERIRELESVLESVLESELNRFRPGDKFITVRELMARYRVSRRVVDGVLTQMAGKGVLEHRPNCGFFVRSRRWKRHVVFFYIDWVSEEYRTVVHSLSREFACRAASYEFHAIPYNYESDPVKLLENCQADFILICWPARPLTSGEIRAIADCPGAVMVLERNLAELGLHCSFRHYEYAAVLTLREFRKKGHRRVALLTAEPLIGGNRVMGEAFAAFARAEGFALKIIPCETIAGNYSPDRAYEAMSDYLKLHGCDFTALFVISEYGARGALLALAEAGIRVPEEVSVIGSGSLEASGKTHPPLTTVGVSLRKSMHELVELIDRNWGKWHDSPLVYSALPELCDRNSVRSLIHPTASGRTTPEAERKS